MIFYECMTAPSPRRARIWLAEKNVPHEVIHIDLSKAEQMGDKYRAINPSCTVPALELDSGTVLTENSGICAYLEAEYPDPPLLGRTPEEKGLVATWTTKMETEGLMAVAEALRNSSPYMKDRALTGSTNHAQIPELAQRGIARTHDFFDSLNEHLAGRDFVITDTFTNADIVAVTTIDFARIVKVKPQDYHKHIIRWRESLSERPSMAL